MKTANQKSSKMPAPRAPKPKNLARDQVAEKAPVASSRKQRTQPPRINYAIDGSSCRIKHRERIGTINGSVLFATNAFAINPGLSASFPWLSAVANRFESYRFEALKYEYRTKSATTGTGDVILAVDYDAADSAPASSIQAEAYKSTVSCAPWQDIDWVAKPADLHKLNSNYVRSSALAANLDIKTYDIGNLFVCTENQSGVTLAGYLYVEYDVLLMTPELSGEAVTVPYGARIVGGGSQTAANPFGLVPVVDAQSLGFSMDAASVLTVQVAGTYVCTVKYTGTVLSNVIATAGANMTVAAIAGMAEVDDGGSLNGMDCFSFISTAANTTVAFTATATTITAANLVIARVPAGLLA